MPEIGPPATERRAFAETLHDHEIVDPYRWLEDAQISETKAWVEAQNAYTRSVLDAVPGRERLREIISTLFRIGMIGTPVQRGDRLFYVRRAEGENQPRLLFRGNPDGEDRVAVDPNRLNAQGITALDWWYPSWEGRFVAYGLSTGGDEQSTMRIFDCDEERDLTDVIPHTRFSTVAWLPDSSGFYYTGVVKNLANAGSVAAYYHRAVYRHRLGTDHLQDKEVFPDQDDPALQPAVAISRDGRTLVVSVHRGTAWSKVYVRQEINAEREWVELTEGVEAHVSPVLADGLVYLLTDVDAPRYRLMAVDPAAGFPQQWRDIVAERPDATLLEAVRAGDKWALHYLSNAHSELAIAEKDGSVRRQVPLGGFVTVTGLGASTESDDLFVGVETFTQPSAIHSLSVSSQRLEVWQLPPGLDGTEAEAGVTVEQVWFPSKDGTKVSMFLLLPSNSRPGDGIPFLLTGYGGFNLNRVPLFDRGWNAWLQLGCGLASANLRGGGEYGEDWHAAGMLSNKQNVFDDFIGAAEYLIEQGHTDRDHLALSGRSNGGLLVGAALTQQPDLYRAVICGVPLLDMVRYHHFLIARLWVPEYGSADDPDQFRYLYAYSPYHQVSTEAEYPAVLFFASASDTRVDPVHARKMTALMQHVSTRGPVLLRLEFDAGHGVGKPVQKMIDQVTDEYTFLLRELGVRPG